jgi:hypothetical protein
MSDQQPSGAGINVGDAVLNFLANTTSLDQAYAKVDQLPGRLAPADAALDKSLATWQQTGEAATMAAAKMTESTAAFSESAAGVEASAVAASSGAANLGSQMDLLSMKMNPPTVATALFGSQLDLLDDKLGFLPSQLQRSSIALTQTGAKFDTVASQMTLVASELGMVPAKMTETHEALVQVAQDWSFLGQKAAVAGQQGLMAGEEIATGARQTAVAMREAKGEVALLGEATGVQVPRHVRGFLASLPGVAPALEAAFAATAVMFLIQALVELTEKATEWIADTFIFTEAMKAVNVEIAETNKLLLDEKEKLKDLKNEYAVIGETGPRKTMIEFMQLNEEIKKNEAALRDAKNTLWAYTHMPESTTAAEAAKAQKALIELNATLQVQYQQGANMQKNFLLETRNEAIAFSLATTEAVKASASSQASLLHEQGRARIAGQRGNYLELAQLEAQYQQDLYTIQLHSLNSQLSIANSKGAEGVAEAKRIRGQIESLELDHRAKILKGYADMMEKLKSITAQPIPLVNAPLPEQIVNEITTTMDKIDAAVKELGIEFSGDLYMAVERARDAFHDLASSGLAQTTDLLQANIKMIEREIEYQKSLGRSTVELRKHLHDLQTQYASLTGVADKTSLRQMHVVDALKAVMKQTSATKGAISELGKIGSDALDSLAAGFQNSVAAAILGEESFGEAMRKATAETLANVSAQAAILAIFQLAAAFASLAVLDFRGAEMHFQSAAIYGAVAVAAGVAAMAINPKDSSGAGGSGEGNRGNEPFQTTGAAGQPAFQPIQQRNQITHFATGGLVTGPTLSLLGDSARSSGSREAALPLDDPDAVSAIVEALGGGNGSTTHFHVKGLVSPDTLKKVAKQLSGGVRGRKLHLTSSNSLRITRRSQ